MENANKKYRVYSLTENGTENNFYSGTLKEAKTEIKILNSVDSFNNYTLLNISKFNKDLEGYLQIESSNSINRM